MLGCWGLGGKRGEGRGEGGSDTIRHFDICISAGLESRKRFFLVNSIGSTKQANTYIISYIETLVIYQIYFAQQPRFFFSFWRL